MDPDMELYVRLATGALVMAVIALLWAAPRLERAFGRGGGRWRDLAKNFATTRPAPAGAAPRQSVGVGAAFYRHGVTVGADDAGLYLAPAPFLAWALRKNLLIPWSAIGKTAPAHLVWGKATSLIVGAPPLATLTLPDELFRRLVAPRLEQRPG